MSKRGIHNMSRVHTAPTAHEPDVQVHFQGFVIDLFRTENGSLGMTIERGPPHEDNPCVDVFVTPELLVTAV